MIEDTTRQGDGRPPSYRSEYLEDWGTWVLEHGLPELPEVLGEDDQVPIAAFVGGRFGTVLFRSRSAPNEDDELRLPGEERDVDDDHYSWIRAQDGWVPVGASGGTGGPLANPMTAPDVPVDAVWFGRDWLQCDEHGSVRGVTATVGTRARYIELEDRHGLTRRPVEAPLGQIVVCFDAADDVGIRIADEHGQILAEAQRNHSEWR